MTKVPAATNLRGPECPYYPCHNMKNMLCDYCYCPLYFVPNCQGNYVILPNGVKDCSHCTRPHTLQGMRIIDSILKNKD